MSYFLIANGISGIIMAGNTQMGRIIRKSIRNNGEFNQILIKPVKLIPYFYVYAFSQNIINNVISLAMLVIGMLMQKPDNLESFGIFILSFIFAALIALSFNVFEGALALIFTEVTGIKNALNHITRVLSGLFVPLSFFPENIRKITDFLPFQFMISAPSTLYKSQGNIINQLLLGLFWVIILNALVFIFWKYALKQYDGYAI